MKHNNEKNHNAFCNINYDACYNLKKFEIQSQLVRWEQNLLQGKSELLEYLRE